MKRIINYNITASDSGKTINEYLRSRYYPAKMLTYFRHAENSIQVNGNAVFMKTQLQIGDKLTVIYSEEDISENIVPVKLDFKIVYEDDDILIVDKPADMPVHPAINNFHNTLANGIAFYFQEKSENFCFRCINRLDRNTSGLLIVAKHRLAAGILSDFMSRREISREYLALATGIFSEKNGTIDLPIGRISDSIIERQVDFENGQAAVTHYEVVDEYIPIGNTHLDNPLACVAVKESCSINVPTSAVMEQPCSLLRIHLDTGRTHQIRVHMSYIGHPLVGDHMYNPNPGSMMRQALHSHKLEFLHPIALEKMSFTSPVPW